MFQKFIFWLNVDPNAKKKILFIVLIILLTISSVVLYSLNTQKATENANLNSNQVVDEVKKSVFDTSSSLQLVASNQIGLPLRIGFNPVNQSPVYVNQDLKLVVNNLVVDNSPLFLPKSFSYDGNNIIINEDFQTTLYLDSGKQLLPLNPEVTYLTKISEGNFLFVTNIDGKLSVRQTNSIGRTNSNTEFSLVTPQIQWQTYELRVFQGQPYLFVYSDFFRTETAEIWAIKAGTSTKILSVNDLGSTRFSETGFLYTQNIATGSISTSYFDLASSNPAGPINLDFKLRLIENKILGDIVAERCVISKDKIIDCLVKETSADYEAVKSKDVLVKLNPITKIVSFPNRDIIFSGYSLTYAPNGSLYLASQELRQLYKFEI